VEAFFYNMHDHDCSNIALQLGPPSIALTVDEIEVPAEFHYVRFSTLKLLLK
jgi:hypothetical protein